MARTDTIKQLGFDWRLAAIAAALALVGTWLAVSTPGSQGGPGPRMILASSADRYPNSTAADWATYADHVVVATVATEEIVPPTKREVARGEGLIMRNLTMKVEEVTWSSTEATKRAPASFDWLALGWEFTTDPDYRKVPMTGDNEPRLEVGKTYLLAIERPDPTCGNGEGPRSEWRGLGAAAVVPFENGVFGSGELEGRASKPDAAAKSWEDTGATFAASMAGRGSSALTSALRSAVPDKAARAAARQDKCR